jgi:hypothetical protein
MHEQVMGTLLCLFLLSVAGPLKLRAAHFRLCSSSHPRTINCPINFSSCPPNFSFETENSCSLLPMSGTCIVCLGDLGESSSEVPALSSALAMSASENGLDQQASIEAPTATANNNATEDIPALIAHLQPCGHNLHNDCLTPWVERANSCPICRQSFYSVELSDKVGGKRWSSRLNCITSACTNLRPNR